MKKLIHVQLFDYTGQHTSTSTFSKSSTKDSDRGCGDSLDWNGMVENVFREEIGKFANDMNTHAGKDNKS